MCLECTALQELRNRKLRDGNLHFHSRRGKLPKLWLLCGDAVSVKKVPTLPNQRGDYLVLSLFHTFIPMDSIHSTWVIVVIFTFYFLYICCHFGWKWSWMRFVNPCEPLINHWLDCTPASASRRRIVQKVTSGKHFRDRMKDIFPYSINRCFHVW